MSTLTSVWNRIVKNPNGVWSRPFPHLWHWMVRHIVPDYNERLVRRTKRNYLDGINDIRQKVQRTEEIRVLFIVDLPAKWKAQSLYNLLAKDKRYRPIIGISKPQHVDGLTPCEIYQRQMEVRSFFDGQGCDCIDVYDATTDTYVDLRPIEPDIVFYQESWYSPYAHHPARVSKFALTVYIPYFVPNYVDVRLDCQKEMHRYYWRHIALNEGIAQLYRDSVKDRMMAGEFVGLGHTMLDLLSGIGDENAERKEKSVIYAPHWTFDHPGNPCPMKISTFTETGSAILAYAKRHPEYHWKFKPHPNLALRLVKSGYMTGEEVNSYYEEWARVGEVCTTGNYENLFAQSRVMITDCGSFLSEYGATGKPIIHLISSQQHQNPPPSLANAYDTYYQARSIKEMLSLFELVIERGLDPKRAERHAAVRAAGLMGGNAAEKIIAYFDEIFGMDKSRSDMPT